MGLDMDDALVDMVHEYEAQQRWAQGEHPGFSSNIAGFVTAGYGDLDDHGDWQFPLYPGIHYLELCRERRLEEKRDKSST